MRKLKADLSFSSLNQLVKDIKTYQGSLDLKCEKFTERLIQEVGIPVIETNVTSFMGDSSKEYNTYFKLVRIPNRGAYGKLVVQNEDILFIEFGAGIYYNNGKTHPQASEYGYGVGTYPNQKYAIDPGYWWYKDDVGNLHLSYGTEATMPVYKASMQMISKIRTIASEVFNS